MLKTRADLCTPSNDLFSTTSNIFSTNNLVFFRIAKTLAPMQDAIHFLDNIIEQHCREKALEILKEIKSLFLKNHS
jgi:hypothetical protein